MKKTPSLYHILITSFIIFSCASTQKHQEESTIPMKEKEFRKLVVHKFGTYDHLTLEKTSKIPVLKKGEVLIKTIASGVSFTDTLVRKGIYPEIDSSLPVTPGYDIVGTIEDLHEDSRLFKVNQKVLALTIIGGYSEYLVLPETSLVPLSHNVDPFKALSLTLPYITAYQMLKRLAKAKKGQILLLTGAGDVGTAIMDLAKKIGLKIYVAESMRKKELIESYGAYFLDRDTPYLQKLQEKEKGGVDIVLDCIGVTNMNRSIRHLKKDGTLISFGFINDKSKIFTITQYLTFQVASFLSFSKKLHFYSIGDWHKKHFSWFSQDIQDLLVMLEKKEISPREYKLIPLEDTPAFHKDIDERKKEDKRIIIRHN